MSVYNNAGTVSKSIDSILDQSFSDFEFIIIDDSSEDGTPDVINSYSDSRIVFVKNKENLGLTKSLNKGIKIARGKYLARIDADDYSFPDRLKLQLGFFLSNPGYVLLGTSFNIIDSDNNILKKVISDQSPEKIYYDLLFQNMFAHSSVMFDIEKVKSIGSYQENYRFTQDYDLWLRLSTLGKIWVLPQILTNWTSTSSNISSSNYHNQRSAYKEIFRKNLKRFIGKDRLIKELEVFHNYYDKYYKAIDKDKIITAFSALKYFNREMALNSPDFYDEKKLRRTADNTLIDLLTVIYKETGNKGKVISFLAKNLFDLSISKEVIKKILRSLREKPSR